MSEQFNELDKKSLMIMNLVETLMEICETMLGVHFRHPRHDIARRFLNEIHEFESDDAEDEKRGI